MDLSVITPAFARFAFNLEGALKLRPPSTGMVVTHRTFPTGSESAADLNFVELTSRDIADAERLLRLLADAATTSTESPDDQCIFDRNAHLLRARAEQILAERKRRYKIFGKAMFGEPAWDLLLLVYISESGPRPTIGRLAELAELTKSTALRWIDYLESQRWIRREPHPTDKRAAFVQLTASGKERLELYLSDTSAAAGVSLA